MLLVLSLSASAQQSIELKNWKFKQGDNPEWRNPGFDDSDWKPIKVGTNWASQGYSDGGWAWYRTKFTLPLEMKEGMRTGILRFSLGTINDYDQTFLNGLLLGQNARLAPDGGTNSFRDSRLQEAGIRGHIRNYVVTVDDSRLLWGKENVLAVKTGCDAGSGGMWGSPLSVGPAEVKDCLCFDIVGTLEKQPEGKLSKTILLKNTSSLPRITGALTITITNQDNGKRVITQIYDVNLEKESQTFTIRFKGNLRQHLKAAYHFTDSSSGYKTTCSEVFPYILTPEPADAPSINGAKVVGVGLGRAFLFRIPATGIRPMTFSAEHLPAGLSLDAATGLICGTIAQAGEYVVKLKATNRKGVVSRDLRIVVGGLLALTPPMGWNSWNGLGYDVSQEQVRTTVDILRKSGLADHGWRYVNIDIGWEPMQRSSDGRIVPNAKFPDMKGLVDYIHSNGFKAGIYISAGPKACSVYGTELGIGSYQHEETDAQTFADWGFDYLKYDWCTYPATDRSNEGIAKPFKVMKAALNKTGRDFVFSIGAWNTWEWGGNIGGNLWRVVSDIEDNWKSLEKGFKLEMTAPYAKPGNWNDPDMLVVGQGWYGNNTVRLHPTHLTPDEQYTHISLWSLLSAPLLIGCDLTRLDDFTLSLLSNDEVLGINQDPLGKQALPAVKNDNNVVMAKDLEDGSKAVGLFNLTENKMKITITWAGLGISGKQKVRDVWRQKDLGTFTDSLECTVPSHGVVLVKVSK